MADRFVLPRIRVANPITDAAGMAVSAFVRFWDTVCRQIEAQEAQQAESIDRLNLFQERTERTLIAISHVDGLTATGEADGAAAAITISDHTRVYMDMTISVTGDVLTGLDYDTFYAVYYDDPAREGGAVSYQVTLNPTEAVPSATNPHRHLVAVVTTPATAGDPPTDGGGTRPPGYPPGGLYVEP